MRVKRNVFNVKCLRIWVDCYKGMLVAKVVLIKQLELSPLLLSIVSRNWQNISTKTAYNASTIHLHALDGVIGGKIISFIFTCTRILTLTAPAMHVHPYSNIHILMVTVSTCTNYCFDVSICMNALFKMIVDEIQVKWRQGDKPHFNTYIS